MLREVIPEENVLGFCLGILQLTALQDKDMVMGLGLGLGKYVSGC